MNLIVDRYNLDKKFISAGQLKIDEKNHTTILTYTDNDINISASGLHHPIKALESLRLKLEEDFNSVIAINGCRSDTAYRPTGGYGTYIIETGKQATSSVSLFEPTKAIEKLCKVEEHEVAYDAWLKSLGF